MTMTPDVDNSDEEEDRGVVYTANSSSSRQRHRGSSANLRTGKRKTGSSSSANVNNASSDPAFLRTRRWVAESSIHDHSHHDSYPGDGLPRGLCSGCGQHRIGESEDDSEETDAIPTPRKSPRRRPQFTPPSSLPQFTPYLFEFARLLSIVPALFGTLYNLHSAYHPEYYKYNPSSVDYYLSALWAVLTGIQCLLMTTGLLTRWQAHYPPLSILIRLLGLQAICWPATHFTLTILNHIKRPLACWAVIGTFTSFSRSVQIWVTSNLDYSDPYYLHDSHELHLHSPMVSSPGVLGPKDAEEYNGGRRLDWSEIGLKCAFPVGIMYFITTWGVILKGEWGAC